MKTFIVAGISTENDQIKFRVANDLAARTAMLVRCGNTAIQLVTLPTAMDKTQAAQHCLTLAEFAEAADVIGAVANKEAAEPKAPKAPKEPKAPKATSTTPVQEGTPDEDGFIEPADEATQVAMSKLAQAYPGLNGDQLLKMVHLNQTPEAFEPSF